MLKKVLKSCPYDYIIYDDCSKYKHSFENYYRFSSNNGVQNHWNVWNVNLFHLQFIDFDTVIFIPSDLTAIDWSRIEAKATELQSKKYIFNILNDGRKKCWNSIKPVQKKDSIKVGFTDCIFFTNKLTLQSLGFYCNPVDESHFKNNLSSGVGKQLTNRINAMNIPIYTPLNTFATHGEHESTMHKEHRTETPLISINETPLPIYIGVATFKGREQSLKRTLISLNNQTRKPTKIFVYDNEVNENITDNGKFEPLNRITEECYYFSVDDDLIYSPYYIERTIQAIEEYKCIVTYHGRILNGLDLNYFKGHQSFHCLKPNKVTTILDVAGTGVTAFKTSYFNPVDLYLCGQDRIADLTFSLEAKKQGKTIMLLKHPDQFIKQQPINQATSCYFSEVKNPSRQNKLANEIFLLK